MALDRRFKILRAIIALVFLSGAYLALAKPAIPATQAPMSASEEARLKQFLDKDGGYRDSKGGYYNPKAGTYTDADGGVVDNWRGYTYKDGSYKSGLGDYWDAPTHTFKLADGRIAKSSVTSAEAIQALRQNVEANGGYDKNLTRRSMFQAIEGEHPPAKS